MGRRSEDRDLQGEPELGLREVVPLRWNACAEGRGCQGYGNEELGEHGEEAKRKHKVKGKGGGRRPTQGVWVFDMSVI